MAEQNAPTLPDRSYRKKTPQQRKAEAYKKDRIYPHEWGGRGPSQTLQGYTALAQRRYRHAVRQRLALLRSHGETIEAEFVLIRRDQVSTWGSRFTLAEWVARLKTERSAGKVGWNYFKEQYSTAKHRERFARFLEALVQGRTQHARDVAQSFALWLNWDRPDVQATDVNARWRGTRWDEPWRHAWLEEFFRDQPTWRERLLNWIREVGADDTDASAD